MPTTTTAAIGPSDVRAAAARIGSRIRPVVLAPADPGTFGTAHVFLALECFQHTGTFKARGAANLAAFHLEAGTMPAAGVVIASGGNPGVACAWAARATGTRATVFLPGNAPAFKVAKLDDYGADVRLVGTEYAYALEASLEHAESSGALLSHAYDHPLIAAGAGTLAAEIVAAVPEIDTIMVAVGGGGLFAGTAAALAGTGVRVVAVEPASCRALNVVVEHAGATALAALESGAYVPGPGERVAVVLCGANTDPVDLVRRP